MPSSRISTRRLRVGSIPRMEMLGRSPMPSSSRTYTPGTRRSASLADIGCVRCISRSLTTVVAPGMRAIARADEPTTVASLTGSAEVPPHRFTSPAPSPSPVVRAAPANGFRLAPGAPIEIAWTGGELPDAYYDEFVFRARLTGIAPGTTVYFPVVQECSEGVHRWIEIPAVGKTAEDYEEPAPGVTILPAAAP